MRNLTNEEKLKGFPEVRYISLRESTNRRVYMDTQLNYYGVKYTPFLVDRYLEFKDSVKIHVYPPHCEPELTPVQFGCTLSHIENMRNWLNNTNEEYVIFCDDDTNFTSIDHWNFTWEEFMANLPLNWECVQLIRMHHCDIVTAMTLDMRIGRWWGTARLMNRNSVAKLLSILCNPDGSYNFVAGNGFLPIVENILFFNFPTVYNFPLVTEFNDEVIHPTGLQYLPNELKADYGMSRAYCEYCNYVINKQWELLGEYLNIKDAMVVR